MAFWTFTPPNTTDIGNQAYDCPDPLANRLAGHYRGVTRVNNVYIWTDNTVAEYEPPYWSNPNGDNPAPSLTRVFFGGSTYTDVTDAQKALLVGAGYAVT